MVYLPKEGERACQIDLRKAHCIQACGNLLLCSKHQHSWAVWKYAVVCSRLSFRQSPHVQQSNKDHQRPTVSVQCTEWHYSWLLFLIIHILAWLEEKQTVYLFSSPTIWWHWMTEGTLMPVDLAFSVFSLGYQNESLQWQGQSYLSNYRKTHFPLALILKAPFPIY